MRSVKVLGLAYALAVCLHAATAPKAIQFGRLWDGHQVLKNVLVVVEGDKITSVTANGKIPPGSERIDLKGYTAIPGMIDMHTHITYYWDGDSSVDARRQKRKHEGVLVALSQRNGMKGLEAGVTTMRDLNAANGADIDLRDLINMGVFVGPRLFVSGGGMHGLPKILEIKDKVAEQIKLTKERLAEGVDWIKVFGSTGGFDNVTGDQTVSYDEMKAIVDTAHAAGIKVAIHSYGPAGARDAIKAGCDTLEHATDMDDATIAEMVRKKIWYVPTIDHNEYYVENASTTYKFPPGAVDNLKDYINRNFLTAQKAYKAGAQLLVGSDAVYNGFGLNMRELTWFTKMGMTNEQALQTATTHAADALGKAQRLGSIAPGFFADIVAVKGDPLSDIQVVIKDVQWVMKGGAVVVDKTGLSAARVQ